MGGAAGEFPRRLGGLKMIYICIKYFGKHAVMEISVLVLFEASESCQFLHFASRDG